MSDWDTGSITSSSQGLIIQGARDAGSGTSQRVAFEEYRKFLSQYQERGNFVLRDALLATFREGQPLLALELEQLRGYSSELHDLITQHPDIYLPILEHAARSLLTQQRGEDHLDPTKVAETPAVQSVIGGRTLRAVPIRDMSASHVNTLIRVPGIVVNASRSTPKAQEVCIRCTNCGDLKVLPVAPGFGSFTMPRQCMALRPSEDMGGEGVATTQKCPLDPYIVLGDRSSYVDQQTIKLQEAPEEVPTGEMPRHVLISCERRLVDRVSPGTRVSVIGVASVTRPRVQRGRGGAGGAIRTPYIRVIGIESDDDAAGRASTRFTPEEENDYRAFAQQPGVYDRLSESVAPSIYGDYTRDIKRAILSLLVAGSRKMLPDGMRLRGDINVLLLGDPSTAKSQFLKFVEKVAPVGVYTSGKGSSAAGLTASVVRDQRGEFYLEGGAMVMADGGVVCIDEFDKMREEDRVAIHEAMEQQTISVAKAGITTVLNSRAAVLAAANPVYGRYDDERSAAENIDFLPSILSRFDLIFIVRDIRDETRDMDIARHVMGVHVSAGAEAVTSGDAAVAGVMGGIAGEAPALAAAEEGSGARRAGAGGDVDLAFMKRYISYARSRCAPRLTAEGAQALRDKYVRIRHQLKTKKAEEEGRAASQKDSVIPITVRQLEALIRLSESVAKVQLATEAGPEHVREAVRLFEVSTLDAAKSGVGAEQLSSEERQAVQKAETRIQALLPMGQTASSRRVKDQLMRGGFSATEVERALRVMRLRAEVEVLSEGRVIRRVR